MVPRRADLLALVCDVYCDFVTFPFGILGQVWNLIVLIPGPCCLSYSLPRNIYIKKLILIWVLRITRNIFKKDIRLNFNCGICFYMYCCSFHTVTHS